jgi:hypothetical protein
VKPAASKFLPCQRTAEAERVHVELCGRPIRLEHVASPTGPAKNPGVDSTRPCRLVLAGRVVANYNMMFWPDRAPHKKSKYTRAGRDELNYSSEARKK